MLWAGCRNYFQSAQLCRQLNHRSQLISTTVPHQWQRTSFAVVWLLERYSVSARLCSLRRIGTSVPSSFFLTFSHQLSNTDGNFGKQPLDKTKLHTLKGNLYQLSLFRYGHGRLKGSFFCNKGFHKWSGRADLIREWWSDLLFRNCVYWFPLFFFFSVDLHNVSSWSRRGGEQVLAAC